MTRLSTSTYPHAATELVEDFHPGGTPPGWMDETLVLFTVTRCRPDSDVHSWTLIDSFPSARIDHSDGSVSFTALLPAPVATAYLHRNRHLGGIVIASEDSSADAAVRAASRILELAVT